MSLLNYGFAILKTASATTSGTCHREQPEGADHANDGFSDANSSNIDSVLPAESDSETGTVRALSQSLGLYCSMQLAN